MSDNRNEVSLASRLHLEDGKPVLCIVVGHALDRARERFRRRGTLRDLATRDLVEAGRPPMYRVGRELSREAPSGTPRRGSS
jgi:hypothetical protein